MIGLSITMPATLIDAWMNRPPIIDPAELPTFLEDFDEEDSYFDDDEDRTGERLVPTGHLLTSRPLDLEDHGLVSSPHTSAGRVPTPAGLRVFVDTLVKVKPLQKMMIEDAWWTADADDLSLQRVSCAAAG